VARPSLHTLIVEQEAAIDKMFSAMAARLALAIRGLPDKPSSADVAAIVQREMDTLFGAKRTEALLSPVGKLILDYANSARILNIRTAIADLKTDREREELLALIALLIADARVLQEVHTYLDSVLAALDYPRGRTPIFPDFPPNMSAQAANILSAIVGPGGTIDESTLDRIADETIRNIAYLVVMALNGKVPRAIDDTARWTPRQPGTAPVDRIVLADRIVTAKTDLGRRLTIRIADRFRRNVPAETIARDMNDYLSGNYTPGRTSTGRPVVRERPGGISRTGRGQGSYPVRRMGRYEATRAYGDTSRRIARTSELTYALRWDLNPAHLETDECDDHAENHSDGLPPGCYYPGEVPFYPEHFGCLCILEPVGVDGERPSTRGL